GGAIDGFDDYDAAVTEQSGTLIDEPTHGSQMLYTSGTTGRPKGVYREPGTPAAAVVNIYGYVPAATTINLSTRPLYPPTPPRSPVLWAAVPRRSAGLLARRAARVRFRRRADGARGCRGRVAPHRRAPRHAHPHGADDVPPLAVAARAGARQVRHDIAALRVA